MKKKALEYLKSKQDNNTFFDKVLYFYANEGLSNFLINNCATDIEISYSIKEEKSLFVSFNYYNVFAVLYFKEEYYEYCVCKSGCSPQELEKNIIKKGYDDKFDIAIFIENFIKNIESNEMFEKIKNFNDVIQSRKKLYSIISIVSFLSPWIILGIIALLSHIMNQEIIINAWFGLIIIASIVLGTIFEAKSR